jgi:hypothetical protein
MRRRPTAGTALVSAALLASGVAGLAGAAAALAPAPLSLKARLTIKSDFPGYERSPIAVFHTPSEWARETSFPRFSAGTLRKLGLVRAATEIMSGVSKHHAQASVFSTVVEFHSHRGAAGYVAMILSGQFGYERFAVHGIPHAYGLRGGGFYDIGFVDGPYFYDLNVSPILNPTKWPSEAETVKAATRWYKRVRGH